MPQQYFESLIHEYGVRLHRLELTLLSLLIRTPK